MTENQVICANPACRIAETGKCVEGLPIAECPHYGKVAEMSVGMAEGTQPPKSSGLRLPNGAALNVPTAAALLGRRASRIIAVIGPRETGKTSLVAGIYDLLQLGPIGDICFAQSKTLAAFELACHDARTASRRDTPHMERTRRGEVLFYHLELGGGAAKDGVSLLLADRSGEEYSDVADDIAAAVDLVEIRRADAITVLVDGARLLDTGRRHNVRMDITMILQGLIAGGALRDDRPVALVLTKLDLIEASPNRARAEADFLELHTHLATVLAGKVRSLDIFKISAAPALAGTARGTGISALIEFWLEERPAVEVPETIFRKSARSFGRVEPRDA